MSEGGGPEGHVWRSELGGWVTQEQALAASGDGVSLDIDPAKARELAAEVEAQWAEMKAHPVIGEFIRSFRIPDADEEP